jgi:hypothetical protein
MMKNVAATEYDASGRPKENDQTLRIITFIYLTEGAKPSAKG